MKSGLIVYRNRSQGGLGSGNPNCLESSDVKSLVGKYQGQNYGKKGGAYRRMKKKLPNIIFFITDQQRQDTLGCYGNRYINTPNLDDIAKGSVVFTQHYVQGAACVPSRPSIFSGRYVSAHLQFNARPLPETEFLLTHYLKEVGYKTMGFGKFHFEPQKQKGYLHPTGGANTDPQPKEFPWYGFDYVEVSEDSRTGLYEEYLKKHGYTRKDDLDSGDIGQWKCYTSAYPEEHYQTTWITNRAIEHIRNYKENKPLFLFVSYVDPHHPFHVPSPYDKMYNPDELPLPIRHSVELENNPLIRERYYYQGKKSYCLTDFSKFTDYDWKRIKAYYYGKISLIDKNVGRILKELENKGLLEDSIIIFTSDHGEFLGDHWLLTKGCSDYDCIIKVPFILYYPEKLPSGLSINSFTGLVLFRDISTPSSAITLTINGFSLPGSIPALSTCNPFMFSRFKKASAI